MLNDSDSEYNKNGKQKYVETFQTEQQKGIKIFCCNTTQRRVILVELDHHDHNTTGTFGECMNK